VCLNIVATMNKLYSLLGLTVRLEFLPVFLYVLVLIGRQFEEYQIQQNSFHPLSANSETLI
jgi:hypothetical protein